MWKRFVLALVTVVGLTTAASAQVFNPSDVGRQDVGRPPSNGLGGSVVSPYLNMTGGGLPGANYYGLVRPQIDTAQSLQLIQQQLGPLNAAINKPIVESTLTTGHAAGYFYTSHYFPRKYPVFGTPPANR